MGEFPAGAVNRAVSSQGRRLGLDRTSPPARVMWQARWSSNAMLAKCIGLGNRAGASSR